jgi:hypothetical protein
MSQKLSLKLWPNGNFGYPLMGEDLLAKSPEFFNASLNAMQTALFRGLYFRLTGGQNPTLALASTTEQSRVLTIRTASRTVVEDPTNPFVYETTAIYSAGEREEKFGSLTFPEAQIEARGKPLLPELSELAPIDALREVLVAIKSTDFANLTMFPPSLLTPGLLRADITKDEPYDSPLSPKTWPVAFALTQDAYQLMYP